MLDSVGPAVLYLCGGQRGHRSFDQADPRNASGTSSAVQSARGARRQWTGYNQSPLARHTRFSLNPNFYDRPPVNVLPQNLLLQRTGIVFRTNRGRRFQIKLARSGAQHSNPLFQCQIRKALHVADDRAAVKCFQKPARQTRVSEHGRCVLQRPTLGIGEDERPAYIRPSFCEKGPDFRLTY